MKAAEVLKELESLGSESYKKIMQAHGTNCKQFGVKIGDLKKIQKKIRKDHALALELYDSGYNEAMYLAGLIVDDSKMTKKDLQRWAEKAESPLIREFTVAWVAAESPHGREMALEWIDSKNESIAGSGWSTLGSLVAITEDADLNIPELKKLLKRVETTIHKQPNRVRYLMNSFVISVGGYVRELSDLAVETARKIGKVEVDMGDTSCKVPDAEGYIKKMKDRGSLGKKRKTAKC